MCGYSIMALLNVYYVKWNTMIIFTKPVGYLGLQTAMDLDGHGNLSAAAVSPQVPHWPFGLPLIVHAVSFTSVCEVFLRILVQIALVLWFVATIDTTYNPTYLGLFDNTKNMAFKIFEKSAKQDTLCCWSPFPHRSHGRSKRWATADGRMEPD